MCKDDTLMTLQPLEKSCAHEIRTIVLKCKAHTYIKLVQWLLNGSTL